MEMLYSHCLIDATSDPIKNWSALQGRGCKTRKPIKKYTLPRVEWQSSEGGGGGVERSLARTQNGGWTWTSTDTILVLLVPKRQMSHSWSRAHQFIMVYLHRTTYFPKQRRRMDHHLVTNTHRMELLDSTLRRRKMEMPRIKTTTPMVRTAEDTNVPSGFGVSRQERRMRQKEQYKSKDERLQTITERTAVRRSRRSTP